MSSRRAWRGLVALTTLSLFPDASFELASIDVLDLLKEVPLAAWGAAGPNVNTTIERCIPKAKVVRSSYHYISVIPTVRPFAPPGLCGVHPRPDVVESKP